MHIESRWPALWTAGLFMGAWLGTGSVGAQDLTPQLVGTWSLVSANDERADGSKVPLYGPQPAGMLVFTPQGRYSIQVCATQRPLFAAKDRLKGTAEEYQAAVQGCNPHWGTYAVNTQDQTIVFNIEHALFTNWESTQQARKFTLEGDVLRYGVPNPAVAAANPIIVWKRAK